MKKTALMLALMLAMAPMAHAQSTQPSTDRNSQAAPVGATTDAPPDTFASGGTGVGAITTEMAVAGLVITAIVLGVALGGGDDDNVVVTTTTTTTTGP